jgi:cytochrome c biogenesis protein ResB
MQNYTLSVAQNAKAVFELKLKEIEALTVQKDWASQIVATGNYMMQLGMILNSVKSLKSVWNNDDLDRGEKII